MRRKITLKNLYFFLALVWGGIILYLSLTPALSVSGISMNSGLIKHILAYFFLSFLIYKSTNNSKLAFLTAGTYGLLIEIMQFMLPYRAFELSDIAINYLSSSITYLTIKLKNRKALSEKI